MPKILRQNVGGVDYTMAGCALTATCTTSASDYVKDVVLSDGDVLSDGMTVVVNFTNGNTAGTAPATLTIYSSDQTNYYSDSELTQPFTLAPQGCYSIEYTGTGNAYSYISYPVVQIGNVQGALCYADGSYAGGTLWNAGDLVSILYTNGRYIIPDSAVDIVQAGNMKPATSNAVAEAIDKKEYVFVLGKALSSNGWYKVANISRRNYGFSLNIKLSTSYQNSFSISHDICINYSWVDTKVIDIAKDAPAVIDKIKVCYVENNNDYMGVYIHYNKAVQNTVLINMWACSPMFVPVRLEADSITWAQELIYDLGTNGIYENGIKLINKNDCILNSWNVMCLHGQKTYIHPDVNTSGSNPKWIKIIINFHGSFGDATRVSEYLVRLNYTPYGGTEYRGLSYTLIAGMNGAETGYSALSNVGATLSWDAGGIFIDNPSTWADFNTTVISLYSN